MKTELLKKTAFALLAGCLMMSTNAFAATEAMVDSYTQPGDPNLEAVAKSKPSGTVGISVKDKQAQKIKTTTVVEEKISVKEQPAQPAMETLKAKVQEDKMKKAEVTIATPQVADSLKKVMYGEDVRDWAANPGDTVQMLLNKWSEESGWTMVWKLDRDYILEAGVVFRGTYMDVSMALLRSFARAVPAPIGTFYKGNRVLVVSTREDENEG